MTLKLFLEQLDDWLYPKYDPEKWVIPLPREAAPTPTRRQPTPTKRDDNVFYHVKMGKYIRRSTDKTADTPPTAFTWEMLDTPTSNADLSVERRQEVTDIDRALLKARDLDEAKAQVIKPYWFKKVSRRDATKFLSEKASGYSDKVVKSYYAVFNASNKEGDTEGD